MHRTTIFLDEATGRELRLWAERERCSVASLIRQAIARQLAEREAASLNLGFLAAGRSGRSDIAERHEELLWQDDEALSTDPAELSRVAVGRRR